MSRVFVVTGGTGALGAAVAKHLVARGDRIAVPHRGGPGFEALVKTLARAEAAFGAEADAADPAAIAAFLDQTVARFGRIDGAALIAGGFAASGTLETAAAGEWDEMLKTNLHSVHATCRALLPHLLKSGGSVVTVGSRSAQMGGAGMAAYAVSKQAVGALTRALALENKSRGVRFNMVLPGTIDTQANRKSMPKADTSQWTPPLEIARVIAFLLSDDSATITGAEIPVDLRGGNRG